MLSRRSADPGRGRARRRRAILAPVAALAAAGVLALCAPAAAHTVSAAEMARLDALVARSLQSGGFGIVLLVISGVGLGALHGLEPGHAKTMMSAFIIAIRGTVGQAVLLGSAATVSHTAIVWLLVVPVMIWGGAIDPARNAPYLQLASAGIVLSIGSWTALRLWREQRRRHRHDGGAHAEAPPGDAGGHAAPDVIDTGHGLVRLEVVEVDGAPRFCVHGLARSGRRIPFSEAVEVETRDADGSRRVWAFADHGDHWQAVDALPARHGFAATLRVLHDDHAHEFPVSFGLDNETPGAAVHADAHERAHAEALRRRLQAGPMRTAQIVLFGLSGGLVPCPAAITVLLLCLQLKRIGLGLILVTSFSVGLALTMIAAGAAAALGARHLSRRWAGFAAAAPVAAGLSCALILCIGLYMLVDGLDAVVVL